MYESSNMNAHSPLFNNFVCRYHRCFSKQERDVLEIALDLVIRGNIDGQTYSFYKKASE